MDEQFLRRVKNVIANHEGRRAHVYLDTVSQPTVGIGFNLDREDAAGKIGALGLDYEQVRAGGQNLTNEQIEALFEADVAQAAAGARQVVSSFDDLTAKTQVVLIDMVFNLGPVGHSHFQDMIAALNAGDSERAALELRESRWA